LVRGVVLMGLFHLNLITTPLCGFNEYLWQISTRRDKFREITAP